MKNTSAFTMQTSGDKSTNTTRTDGPQYRDAAFRAIYDVYFMQIYKFIFLRVNNREDAEDLTSQVFIKAANSLDTGRETHFQIAWLYQVASTTVTDHWRRYYRGVTASLEAIEEECPLYLAAAPTYGGGHEVEERNRAVERVSYILERLPENHRRVLELRFLKGCSSNEAAAAMKVTGINARVLQHRAIRKAFEVGARLF